MPSAVALKSLQGPAWRVLLCACLCLQAGLLGAQTGVDWQMAIGSRSWPPRIRHTAIAFAGKLWVIGGDTDYGFRGTSDEVWSTTDGALWTLVTHGPFTGRAGESLLVYGGKLWLLGGKSDNQYRNDVWSTPDGMTWTQETGAAPWTPRAWMGAAVFNNRLWVLGGADGGTAWNDAWSSADGKEWTQETAAAAWSPRYQHGLVAFGGRLWIFGGHAYYAYLYDIWSSADGREWKLETEQSALGDPDVKIFELNGALWAIACFLGNSGIWTSNNARDWTPVAVDDRESVTRDFEAAAVYNGRLWIMGGIRTYLRNDTWSSADGAHWQRAGSAPWGRRAGHTAVAHHQRLWLIGGYDGLFGTTTYYQDVWASIGGTDWIRMPAPPWPGRAQHASVVFEDKIWVLGGVGAQGDLGDVWSSADGQGWAQATASAPWGPREQHEAVVFKNRIWVLGGLKDGAYQADVWSSANGRDWTLETAAAWPARAGHVALVFDNRLWVLGGDGGTQGDAWWSEDGKSWNQATDAAGWVQRMGHAGAAFEGRMWVLGGEDPRPRDYNDVWSSGNGADWDLATNTAPWERRKDHAAVVFANRIWVIGGYDRYDIDYPRDVWYTGPGQAEAKLAWVGYE